MSFTVGDTIGQYRIMDQLGQGGMATVYKAYHANLDRYVAFKVLHPAFKEDPNFLERFKREAQIVARLEHPHIVPVYDYAAHESQPYLVMKFIEGESLKARLKRQPPTLDETIRLLEIVASALTYAHQHGILHRDIKPSNIMLDREGTPFITDFGLARIAQAGESTLSQDMMLGTPQYISPEQAKGVQNLGPGTDIYSLGVIIYEMVVGRVPFNADTPFAIIHDHIYKPLPLPTHVNPEVPFQVEQVLLKALSKEPDDRYVSAVEMIEAFRNAVKIAGMTELSAAACRPAGPSEALTTATTPESVTPAQTPVYMGVPSPVAQTAGSTASRRAYRRRANLWILTGFGILLLTCLASLFIIVRAVSNEELQPWNIHSKADAAEPADQPFPENAPDVMPDLSVDQAQAAVEEKPGDAVGYLNLALAQIRAGDRESAFSSAVYAVTQLEPDSGIIARMARRAASAEQDDLATWLYLEVIAQPDLSPDLREEAGSFLADRITEDPARARTIINSYMDRRLQTAPIQTMNALALLQTDRAVTRQAAKRSLDSALELDDSLAEAYLVRGLYYYASDNIDEAVVDWRYAISFADAPDWVIRQAHDLIDGVETSPAS